jgi:2-aminoadipate transaminase
MAANKKYLSDQTVISGSFSKIIAPGMRIGWMLAPEEILTPFNIAQQAADLRSNFFCQKILRCYLTTCNLDARLHTITAVYRRNCQLRCDLLDDILAAVTYTYPGGCFSWQNCRRKSFPAGFLMRG